VADSRVWERQARLLRGNGYDVETPDLPGFGTEPVPTERFSFVERIATFLPAVLVGNSFGGQIALATALRHPDRVPALILVDASLAAHDWSETITGYWEREEALVDAGDLDAATDLTLDLFVQPRVRSTVAPMQRRAYELQLAVPEPDVEPLEVSDLGRLTMPVLVLVGEDDVADFHAIAQRIVGEAPNARLAMVPDAKHLPALENPDEFERLLLDFLREHGI
jgi:3-oxoadipate enol-lactonase